MARRSSILLIVCSPARSVRSRPEVDSELRQLRERARDADHLGTEVNRHRAGLHPDDPADAVGVVRDELADLELLDDRLGVGLEGAAGKVSTPYGWSCHHCKYAPSMVEQ